MRPPEPEAREIIGGPFPEVNRSHDRLGRKARLFRLFPRLESLRHLLLDAISRGFSVSVALFDSEQKSSAE